MGLGLSHGDFHTAYSGFYNWRNRIAKDGGYELKEYEWERHSVTLTKEWADIDWDIYTQDNYDGIWEETPEDILLVLIVHQDCEGIITNEHCYPLAIRLKEIHENSSGDKWHNDLTKKFIVSLMEAYESGEDLEFC